MPTATGKLAADLLAKYGGEPAKKPHKYHAQRTEVDGITFASKLEAARYGYLKMLEKAQKILILLLQPQYTLTVQGIKICKYIADFRYFTPNGQLVVEDCKGVSTPVFRIKAKLMKALYGIDVVIVKKANQ